MGSQPGQGEAYRNAGLEGLCLEPDDEILPGSIQPVIHIDENGER